MQDTRSTWPWERNLYRFLFVLGALVHLSIWAVVTFEFTAMWFLQLLSISLIVLAVLMLIDRFLLRDIRLAELRLGTFIGLLAGNLLSQLIGWLASLEPFGAIAAGFYTLMVFPFALIWAYLWTPNPPSGEFLLIQIPHLLSFIGMGYYSFFVVKRSGSRGDGIRNTFFLAWTITLFTFLLRVLYSLFVGRINDFLPLFLLFELPLVPLLFYALVAGLLGALLGRQGHQAMVSTPS
jgi:hypothetical protein